MPRRRELTVGPLTEEHGAGAAASQHGHELVISDDLTDEGALVAACCTIQGGPERPGQRSGSALLQLVAFQQRDQFILELRITAGLARDIGLALAWRQLTRKEKQLVEPFPARVESRL